MIIGCGVDVVEVARFERALKRAPRLRDRLFAQSEQVSDAGVELSVRSLAARFAAKEAVIKTLGHSDGVRWHDIRVLSSAQGKPELRVSGGAATAAQAAGIERMHVSLSHDGGIAMAFVVGESL